MVRGVLSRMHQFKICMMKAKRFLSLLFLSLMVCVSLRVQDTVTMNLKDCMRYTVEHSTKMRIAQADYEQTLQSVEAEVRRAIADRDGSADALRQAAVRAELQEEAYTLNGKRFEQGLISSIEYQTASGNYLNALAEHLNARLQYFIKSSVVTYYGGTPYIEQ